MAAGEDEELRLVQLTGREIRKWLVPFQEGRWQMASIDDKSDFAKKYLKTQIVLCALKHGERNLGCHEIRGDELPMHLAMTGAEITQEILAAHLKRPGENDSNSTSGPEKLQPRFWIPNGPDDRLPWKVAKGAIPDYVKDVEFGVATLTPEIKAECGNMFPGVHLFDIKIRGTEKAKQIELEERLAQQEAQGQQARYVADQEKERRAECQELKNALSFEQEAHRITKAKIAQMEKAHSEREESLQQELESSGSALLTEKEAHAATRTRLTQTAHDAAVYQTLKEKHGARMQDLADEKKAHDATKKHLAQKKNENDELKKQNRKPNTTVLGLQFTLKKEQEGHQATREKHPALSEQHYDLKKEAASMRNELLKQEVVVKILQSTVGEQKEALAKETDAHAATKHALGMEKEAHAATHHALVKEEDAHAASREALTKEKEAHEKLARDPDALLEAQTDLMATTRCSACSTTQSPISDPLDTLPEGVKCYLEIEQAALARDPKLATKLGDQFPKAFIEKVQPPCPADSTPTNGYFTPGQSTSDRMGQVVHNATTGFQIRGAAAQKVDEERPNLGSPEELVEEVERDLQKDRQASFYDAEDVKRYYARWCKRSRILDCESDNKDGYYELLTDLCILADYIGDKKLHQAALIKWQEMTYTWAQDFPPWHVVVKAFAALGANARLCKWLARFYGLFYWRVYQDRGPKIFDSFEDFIQRVHAPNVSARRNLIAAATFLFELVEEQAPYVTGGDEAVLKEWCTWHEHSDLQEEQACKRDRDRICSKQNCEGLDKVREFERQQLERMEREREEQESEDQCYDDMANPPRDSSPRAASTSGRKRGAESPPPFNPPRWPKMAESARGGSSGGRGRGGRGGKSSRGGRGTGKPRGRPRKSVH